jgi:purple acid phosphatase-like protein/calcineurin-like phosphoesterase family protein
VAENLLSRRSFLGGVTASGIVLAGPAFWQQSAIAGAPDATQVHLTYGANPGTEMVVSWVTATSVQHPRVTLGTATGGFGRVFPAETRSYTDYGGVQTITQHARIFGLWPDTDYVYSVQSDGATPVQGTFRTAPQGRVPFRFTSFGDLGSGNPSWSKSSLNAITATNQIEQFDPVVHILNGDLSYANVNQASMPAVWADFFNNTQPSSMHRPWMPTLGNHEVEAGNGPQGYLSYQTRYTLPGNGSSSFSGNWYSFQVGSVLFVALDNNDVVYENDGGVYAGTTNALYIRGYSNGQQEAWLERTLQAARFNPTVDWIVAYMHQTAMSTSSSGSGSDLGIRQSWMPLFYKYGVDLVLCGHDHDYERSYQVKGTDAGTYLRPTVVSTDLTTVDTSKGLVHIVLGGGGTSSHDDIYGPPDTEYGDPLTSQIYTEPLAYKAVANESEVATWSAVRDPNTTYPWGIGVFDVDPGQPGGTTSITVTYYHTPAATASNLNPAPIAYDTFTATRPRRDGGFFGAERASTPARA